MSGMRVLVVDDDEVLLEIIEKMLSELNLEIIKTTSGREAVKLYLKLKPDLVLMDIVIEELDSVQAVREIRKINSDAKIIILSSFARPFLREFEKTGVHAVLKKPFRKNDLIETVKAII
jgi:two-component system chemotaxis response regulator CheY